MCSNLQRRPFYLYIPDTYSIKYAHANYSLDRVESDWRNYRQRAYMDKIPLPNIACSSNYNICVKIAGKYLSYICDHFNLDDASVGSESDSDIPIEDYPVQDLYPVFNILDFKNDFEKQILEKYSIIIAAEEAENELQVTELLEAFENQKKRLREQIFALHKEAFHLRRDISEHGQKLERIYKLQAENSDKPDKIQFEIDRLAIETEAMIDNKNLQLRSNRDRADRVLSKYRKYIDKGALLLQT